MPLPKVLTNLFSGGASKLIDSAKGIISEFHLSPEDKLKAEKEITALLNQHAQAMEQEVTKQMDIQAKENDSARAREIAIATSDKAPLLNKIITPILALIIVCSTLVIWALILFRNYEPKSSESMIIGALTTLSAGVISYYFGSSLSSHNKDKQINNMMK